MEGLDVSSEVLAVLEVEVLLATLLRRGGEGEALGCRIPENGRSELLIHEDAGLGFGDAGGKRALEAVVDDLFGGGNLRRLRGIKGALPAEHFRLEAPPVVERQNVKGRVIAANHVEAPFSFR